MNDRFFKFPTFKIPPLKISGFQILIALIILFGVFLRVKAYFLNLPLWADEHSLASNVINRSYLGLLKPLDYTQCAPFGFLVLTKFVTKIFGEKEMVFRFFPFLASVLSPFVFYVLSAKVLNKKWSIILVNYLFAVNTWLVYYTKEFKQYSIEVLLVMLSVLYISKLDLKTLTTRKCVLFGFLFFGMFLFAMPVVFVMAAFFLYLIYKNKKDSIRQIFFITLPFAVFALPYYFIYLAPSKIMMNATWYHLWSNGYIKFTPAGLYHFFGIFFSFSFGSNYDPLPAMVMSSFGTYFVFKDKKRIGAIILLIFLSAILASIFEIYPILFRLQLYLTPFMLLIAVKTLDKISFSSAKKVLLSLLIITLFSWCFRTNCIKQVKRLLGPDMYYSNMKCDDVRR